VVSDNKKEPEKRNAVAWMLSKEPYFRRTKDDWTESCIKAEIKEQISKRRRQKNG
jgi:hypothetical protein